jgi:small basic protein
MTMPIAILAVLAALFGYLLARAEKNDDGTAVYPFLAAMAVGFLMVVAIGFINYKGGQHDRFHHQAADFRRG